MKKSYVLSIAVTTLFACGDCGDSAENNAQNNANNASNNTNNQNNVSDMGNNTNNPNLLSVTLPPNPMGFGPLTLTAGNPVQIPLTFSIPADADFPKIVQFAVDAQETAELISITRTDGANTPDPTLRFRLAVASGSDAQTTCNSAPSAVDLTITGNSNFSEKTAEDSGDGGSSLAATLTGGEFTACFEMESSVNVQFNMAAAVEMEFDGECVDEPPQDLVGTWAGTYACTDDCGGSEGGDIELTVLQAGETAVYFDDGGAFYFGSVCGEQFSFYGGAMTYAEWGRLTRTGANTAEKTSTYRGNGAQACTGDCVDELTLQ